MRFLSTRRGAGPVGFSETIRAGLAPDGGLFVPEELPIRNRSLPKSSARSPFLSLPVLAEQVLAPFLEGDALADSLREVAKEALDFPVPLEFLERETAVLELFHGPTAAFKDVGARFLAGWAERLGTYSRTRPGTVLVATSGDTGGAVAAAFDGRPGFRVFILYPKGRISARQERQLTCWGPSVRALAVRGDFDDCQRMLKEAFLLPQARGEWSLISANSINIGRILPQTTYYAYAATRYLEATGHKPGLIVPTGNLGNALAALWAREMGFPIREVVLATNSNRVIELYLRTGRWTPEPTVATLANAMDVGNPSNIERLNHLYGSWESLRSEVSAVSVSDDEIRETIAEGPGRWGRIWCPHTATAVHARENLDTPHWIVVATAHPAKFDTIVEPLVGQEIAIPPALAALLKRESRSEEIEPKIEALIERLSRAG